MNSDLVHTFTAIEKVLGSAKIKDFEGNVLPGDQCFGYLEKKSNGEWGGLLDAVQSGEISEAEFSGKSMTLTYRIVAERRARLSEKAGA